LHLVKLIKKTYIRIARSQVNNYNIGFIHIVEINSEHIVRNSFHLYVIWYQYKSISKIRIVKHTWNRIRRQSTYKKKVEFLIKKFKSNLSQLIIKKYIGRTIEIQFYNWNAF